MLDRRMMLRTVASVALVASCLVGTAAAATFTLWSTIKPAIGKVRASAGYVYDSSGRTDTIKIVDFGKTVFVGSINTKPTLDRIRANSKLPHNNDGSVFTNSAKLLPSQPSGYYIEFVHWPYASTTSSPYGMTFPGPMRVILGKSGETYFTGDHYSSFQIIR